MPPMVVLKIELPVFSQWLGWLSIVKIVLFADDDNIYLNINNSMSFSKKAAEIMHTLQTDYGDFKVPINRK